MAAVHVQDDRAAIRDTQAGFKRLCQTLLNIGTDFDAVNHHINRVFFSFLQLWQIIRFVDACLVRATLNPEAHKTLRLHLFKQIQMLTFAVRDYRRQNHQLGFFRHRQHGVYHLRDRLRCQRIFRMVRAVRRTHAGVQQTQIIVDFRDCADGRTRVVRGRFLFNRNRRRQTFDQIHIRFFHQLQELARIGRQGFHIAALTFCIQRIKRE